MQPTPIVPPPPPTKPARSEFIQKLHELTLCPNTRNLSLLEHPYDPDNMRWVSDTAFEITCNDALARRALSAKWEFRSLSSFIRQLSYYSFKRLSDRRRSGERKSGQTSFIVFTHPSGYFVRGDNSMLHGIVRKTRTKTGKRRASQTSIGSADRSDESPPPLPQTQWQPPQFAPQYGADRRTLTSMLTKQPHAAVASPFGPPPGGLGEQLASWRSYQPVQPGWNPGYVQEGIEYGQRRMSLGDVRPTMPISPRDSKELELPPAPLPSSSGVPHHLRKASSNQSMSVHAHHEADEQRHPGYRGQDPYSTLAPANMAYEPYPVPQAGMASGLTLPYSSGHAGPSEIANHPQHENLSFPSYQHYSHAYPSRLPAPAPYEHSGGAMDGNPLPSPSYSDGGEIISAPAHHSKANFERAPASLVGSAAPAAKNIFAASHDGKRRPGPEGGSYFDEAGAYSTAVPEPRHSSRGSSLSWAPPPVKATSRTYDASVTHK
ncbi:hypothetical protein OIV83_005561 [Microbotryomycetes sp. JL201]|nr:hypothetical protein OIV83_005561 [Microbotryomycetes sp. JL201]